MRKPCMSVEITEVLYVDGRIILIAALKETRFDSVAWFQTATCVCKSLDSSWQAERPWLQERQCFMRLVTTELLRSDVARIKIITVG